MDQFFLKTKEIITISLVPREYKGLKEISSHRGSNNV